MHAVHRVGWIAPRFGECLAHAHRLPRCQSDQCPIPHSNTHLIQSTGCGGGWSATCLEGRPEKAQATQEVGRASRNCRPPSIKKHGACFSSAYTMPWSFNTCVMRRMPCSAVATALQFPCTCCGMSLLQARPCFTQYTVITAVLRADVHPSAHISIGGYNTMLRTWGGGPRGGAGALPSTSVLISIIGIPIMVSAWQAVAAHWSRQGQPQLADAKQHFLF